MAALHNNKDFINPLWLCHAREFRGAIVEVDVRITLRCKVFYL